MMELHKTLKSHISPNGKHGNVYSATVHEESMLGIGALAFATGPKFGKYVMSSTSIWKWVFKTLKNTKSDVVEDFCRALEDKILPYCDGTMAQLLKDLSSNQLHRSVKPPIISCFGDNTCNSRDFLGLLYIFNANGLECNGVIITGADDEILEYTNLL